MHRKWDDILVTPGSLCSDRLPAALARPRKDLRPESLAEAICKAGQVLHVKAAERSRRKTHQSPWAQLFAAEPAFVYAELISFNVRRAAFEFERAIETDPAAASGLISRLSRQLKGWIERLPDHQPSQFSKQVQQLNAEADLQVRLEKLARTGPAGMMRVVQSITPVISRSRADALQQARALVTAYRSTHALLRNAVETLRPHAIVAFEQRIASGDMEPALGLLIAELCTALSVDGVINGVTDRFVRFYYQDIIGQHPALASPERVLLHLDSGRQSLFLPEGTRLSARKDDNTVQNFATEAPVHVSSSRLQSVATLSYETDPQISFNAELGGITGLQVTRWTPGIDPPLNQTAQKGAEPGLFSMGVPMAARMGLDIASPMLALAQGTRRITVSLVLQRAAGLAALPAPVDKTGPRYSEAAAPETELMVALQSDPALVQVFRPGKLEDGARAIAKQVERSAMERGQTPSLTGVYEYLATEIKNAAQLRLLLGRIITLCLIERIPFPTGPFRSILKNKIDTYETEMSALARTKVETPDAPGSMILEIFGSGEDDTVNLTPEDMFQKLLGDAFDISLSTADGPISASVTQILPSAKSGQAGVTIALALAPGMPAIAAQGSDGSPTLSLRNAANPRICPISFFERYTLKSVEFEVHVSGMRKLHAWSDDGPVVTDQTFFPFGARPQDGATFLVANPELARKPVTHVEVDLTWAELPDRLGGFAAHYANYAGKPDVPDPLLTVDYLSGDGWKPVNDDPLPLFDTLPVTGELTPARVFGGRIKGHSVRATGRLTPEMFGSRQNLRAGAVRLSLSGTAGGFHADQYPLALVEAMRPRLMSFKERKIPPAPFVPKIDDFAISYTARSTIEVNAPDAANPGETIVQFNPFGQVEVFPNRMLREIGLFPSRLGFGHLFIQLAGDRPTGPVPLLFDMAESGHLRLVPRPNPVKWYYLAAHGWMELPDTAISSDSTAGLMRSGLVMVDLPEDALNHSPEMPNGGVWIAAVATEAELHGFPVLSDLKTNGVWAQCTDGSYHDMMRDRVWTFAPAQPGIAAITEVPTPADVRPPEQRDAYVARVGERLRHRKRAITPWDIERLVLDAFPEVWMAKCLPGLQRISPDPAPGKATLVVVRQPPPEPSVQMFDVSTLQRIRDYIDANAPVFADLEVVNPTFDRLHVRAKLAFDPYRDDGAMAQRLQRDLRNYLSVWTASDTLGRFGWSLNLKMLNAHINDLEYVRGVTDFSVLHLAADDEGAHVLLDSAQDDWRGTIGSVIRGSRPWSLPLSAAEHALTVVEATQKEKPIQSGISRLSVGGTLIVGQRISS
ncbi:baseplate J/gp47 family protein [Roseobacter sp. YSTF-M11]|uniref:Baseplate J/gp47 family protein n=1 Tax=Roseobacter insulae TaxID=2859783 RepID=A0A9X1JWY2_9RHOB|nr:baseplate J/gp47 family protein [Roseobacter insulae]MBW4706650.1 baseplate J/gp47 family protein [Roseobacter insulae]